jgi:subtilisin family serine protease
MALRGFLIRVRGEMATLDKTASFGLGETRLQLEPLFRNQSETERLGAAPAPRWFLAESGGSLGDVNPWDATHEAMRSAAAGLSVSEGNVFVEPDLEQQFITGTAEEAMAATGVEHPQDPVFPEGPGFAWFLGDQFSQLKTTRELVKDWTSRVRIAHLDTGYDPNHHTKPEHLRPEFGWNFVENKRDASDPRDGGVLKNPGHGAATLGLVAGDGVPDLKGDFLGGAPLAEVIPLRIANSVVLFRTSALAKALDWVLKPTADSGETLPPVDVVTLSMGGVASQAWAEAVNRAYDSGICMVAAAGNNFAVGIGHFPTRFIVYPARFRRVIAVCGIMANYAPYDSVPTGRMEGNFGPSSKMGTAIAAYTPNMPWAEIGSPDMVNMNGQGTSAATPQIAAAAALWLQAHAVDLAKLSAKWQRVEAVRQALFSTAQSLDREKLGNGVLRALAAIQVPVASEQSLVYTPSDSAFLPIFRVLTGIGMAAVESPRERMFSVEAAQLLQRWPEGEANPFEAILPDPDVPAQAISAGKARQLLEIFIHHPYASNALKERCKVVYNSLTGGTPVPPVLPKPTTTSGAPGLPPPAAALSPAPYPPPVFRCLRGFALDPSLRNRLETAPISTMTFRVPWESVEPGPAGEYLEVVDYDPVSKCFYDPVDLEDPRLLAQEGFPPSEDVPQFHQQMVYAVASLTIRHFEQALGRVALWRPGPTPDPKNPYDDSHYVRRLRIYPHALQEANAYYSPQKIALLFGYYAASDDDPADHIPGGTVFTCLSHDVVAHETTHALLDGMHRSYSQPSNPDMLAFHEAFADTVALLQHFTYPQLVRQQIAQTRGDLRAQETVLAQLASEFGRTTGKRTALRDAIGRYNRETGKWEPRVPNPQDYENATEAHERGAILVAAIFDAFLSIYQIRTADLLRLATGGSGILPMGALHPDLINRLSEEISLAASHVLGICIRALDYCPPTDLTFGEYLRALITADHDLVEDDDLHYRVAFIEAFRRRGIYPRDLRTLSEESLLWRGPSQDDRLVSKALERGIERLRRYAEMHLYAKSRQQLFYLAREMRVDLHDWLLAHLDHTVGGPSDGAYLGLDVIPGKRTVFEVRAARFANRVGPDGNQLPQFVIELLQEHNVAKESETQAPFLGGCTLIADLRSSHIRYCIRKDINSQTRAARQAAFRAEHEQPSLRDTYFHSVKLGEPFAMLHRG